MNKPFDKILSKSGEDRYLIAPKTVYDFFTEGIYFRRIPDYQRPYSWTTQNVEDLLKDVKKVSEIENATWFFGPLFSVIEDQNTRWADLLDGQQRITTMQIILRELSLVLLEEEGIDFDANPKLFKDLKKIITNCKQCLVKSEGFEEKPVFYTENSIKSLFEFYILEFNDIETKKELDQKREQFKMRALHEAEEGSKTAKRILEAIKEVQTFFKKNFFHQDQPVSVRYENFFKFIKSLLWDCWLLEIPLEQHLYSTQIFESINNRGKPLSLVDKLRYKSIIFLKDDSLADEVKALWKKIYSGTERMDDRGYIKNEDDFYKVFFNSLKGSNFTKEADFIKFFETKYSGSDSDILVFLRESLAVIEFYDYINDSLSVDNEFIKAFSSKEQNTVRSLLEVLKKTLNVSDNSRLILFQLIRKHQEFNPNKYIIVRAIWNLTKLVLAHEVVGNTPSNEVRTDYMDIVEAIEEGKYNYHNFNTENSDYFSLEDKSITNLIRTTSNDEAKLILYFYTYCFDPDNLISGSSFQYKKSELDHLFPKAWKQNWDEKKFKKEQVVSALEKLDVEYFESVTKKQFVDTINILEGIELKDYEKKPFKTPNCIIEFIGNKWVLNDKTNASTGNSSFEIKKDKYSNSNFIKVPKNEAPEIGMDEFSDFGYREIVKRTVVIVNGIHQSYNLDWDEA